MAPEFPVIRREDFPLLAQVVSLPNQSYVSGGDGLKISGVGSVQSLAALGCFEPRQPGVNRLTSLKYRLFPTKLPFHQSFLV